MKNQFLQKIQNSLYGNKTFKKKSLIAVHRDWVIILWSMFISAVVLIVFSFYLLQKIRDDEIFHVNKNTSKNNIVVNQKLLDDTISRFVDKSKNTESVLKNKGLFIDPSK